MGNLKIEHLTHIYSKGTPFEKAAIQDVSFALPAGQFVALIGHTGSGKSTLIQHLNGLLTPTQGTVYYDGIDIHSKQKTIANIRFLIGMVFQYPEYQLFEETVYADIAFGPKNMKLSAQEIDLRVQKAARFSGLSPQDLQKSPLDLSGGQKRRVAIAGVIAMEPEVLILDEPTAGLDPQSRTQILQNIQTYHKQTQATILYITHNMEDAAAMADRILVMSQGKLCLDGTPDEVFAQEDALHSMGLALPEVSQIAAALRARGVALPSGLYTLPQLQKAILTLWNRGTPSC